MISTTVKTDTGLNQLVISELLSHAMKKVVRHSAAAHELGEHERGLVFVRRVKTVALLGHGQKLVCVHQRRRRPILTVDGELHQ